MRVRIYGDPKSLEVMALENQLRARWKELQLSADGLQILYWPISYRAGKGLPSVDIHVHFDSDGSVVDELQRAVDAEETLFAVVADAPAAGGLPAPLAKLNAFLRSRYGGYWEDALVDEILTRAVLPRRTPNIFISYRRNDSENVAKQLHAEFTRLGFFVFLDTVSVGVAEDFQKELMWRLNDADLVILLASPRLEESDWVRKEIEFAKSSSLGMQIVRWPEFCFESKATTAGKPLDPGMLCALEPRDLEMDGLSDEEFQTPFSADSEALHALTLEALDRVVAQALRVRVIAIHERRLDLMGYVYRCEKKLGRTPQQGSLPGDLIVDRDGASHLIRVFPFRPEPVMLKRAAEAVSSEETSSAAYRENDPFDERATALRWLADRRGFSLHPVTGGDR